MNTKELPVCRIVRHLLPPAPHDETVRRHMVQAMHPEAVQSWSRLYAEQAMYHIGRQPYEDQCAHESHHLFWAVKADSQKEVLGMMFCTPIRLFNDRIGVLHDFIVARAHQRRGIAGLLLEAVIAWTREESHANGTPQIEMLQTSVSRNLRSAANFLKKHSFRQLTDGDDLYYELSIMLEGPTERLQPRPR